MKNVQAKDLVVRTYRFPGKYMSDDELERLRGQLRDLALRCLGEVPDYGVFLSAREPYANRIITVAYARGSNKALGFNAMVIWPVRIRQGGRKVRVVHLGLVMVDPDYRGRMLMYRIYHQPLSRYFWRRLWRPFWITSTTAEPVIFGSVADNFSQVYPHYLPDRAARNPLRHRVIAEAFVSGQGHEIGLSEHAWLDPERFIIRDSSMGASKELMHDFAHSAMYRSEACNRYLGAHLHYDRGDEFIQVARVDLWAVFRSVWWNVLKARKKLGFS